MDLPFLDFVSLLLEFFSDVGVRHRAIQRIVLADLAANDDFDAIEHFPELVRVSLLLRFLLQKRLALRLDNLHVSRRRGVRQFPRQQIVSRVAVSHLHSLAGTAKVIDGFNALDTNVTNLLPPVVLLLTRRTLFSG